MGAMPPQPGRKPTARSRIRVGDKGRERAAGVIQRAYVKGQLTQDELDARLAVVLCARVRNDLRPVLEDLEEYELLRSDPKMWRFWLD